MKRLRILIGMVAILVGIALIVPAGQSTNCGGNSAALAACRQYLILVELWKSDHSDKSFSPANLDAEGRNHLRQIEHTMGWASGARILAQVSGVSINAAAPKRIVCLCDRPFNNVPRRRFWSAPLTHAVGYSNGEIGLISAEEYADVDLSEFVDLCKLDTN